ncbi:MAG TPA: cohesin domain-containing protein [Herpetosiphonaceae bacterium]
MTLPASSSRPMYRMLLALLPALLILVELLGPHPSALAADGDLDTSFVGTPLTGASDIVYSTALQVDGKVVLGGEFTSVNGAARNYIARLNADGSTDTTFIPGGGANSTVYSVAVQPDGKILIGGTFTMVNGVGRNRIARLNADGSLDTSFAPNSGANGAVYKLLLQPDGKILVAGGFTALNGNIRDRIARLNADGTLDTSFTPTNGANNDIYELALQPDGKVVIGGAFTLVNGTNRNRIARLNANGALDTTFAPSDGANGTISALGLQADGKILIGGVFSAVNSLARTNLARLNADGTIDSMFGIDGGANGNVQELVPLSDGKILVTGDFTTINGVGRSRLARLNADGSLDTGFSASANGESHKVLVQTDGRLLLVGAFTTINGVGRSRVVRLNADGSLDPSFVTGRGTSDTTDAIATQTDGKMFVGGSFSLFNDIPRSGVARLNTDGSLDPAFNATGGINGRVFDLVVQPDGKVVVGGSFTTINGVGRSYIARFNTDGSLDTAFAPIGANNEIYELALQTDGKILVGGAFTSINGVSRNRIARLNADGTTDTAFAPTGANSSIDGIAIQPDGKIVVGGWFTSMNGVSRSYIARLNVDGSLDTTFAASGGANSGVLITTLQADGKILIGGTFTSVSNVARNYIARLNADGSLDTSFAPGGGANNHVYKILAQADGKLIVGGAFTTLNGVSRNRIGRFNADGSLDATFAPGGANASVIDMAIQSDGRLLAVGGFTTFNNTLRNRIVRLQASANTPPTSPSPSPSPIPAGPRLFLSRPNVAVAANQTFQIDLRMDTDGRDVDTMDAYLNFDPTLLEVIDGAGNPVTSLTVNSGIFDGVTFNQVNNSTGQINLSLSKYSPAYPRGLYTIATLRFRAKAAAVSTPIRFVQTGARWSDLLRAGVSLEPSFGNTSVRILSAVTLNGRVALEQRGASGTSRWITPLFRTEGVTTTGGIYIYQRGTTNLVGQFSATTDVTGRFNVTLDGVQADIYDIRVKGANTLSNLRTNVDLSDPTIEFDFGTLRVGDSNGNDAVNGADVSYMIPSFLLTSDDPAFRAYADTNNNGAVNGADVSALIPNFLRAGPLTDLQAQTEPMLTSAQSDTLPIVGLSPALQQVKVGDIVPVEVQLHLGAAQADTADLYLNFDPQALEVVDASGSSVKALTPNRAAFPNVTYNDVDNARGQINLSTSRYAGATSGSVTVATFYVKVERAFTTTPITVARSGARQSDVFIGGTTLRPAITGGLLTMQEIHRLFVPAVNR